MRRFVQVVLYVQMAFLGLAGVVGFLAHRFPIAAQEQPLARQVGFLLGYVAIVWLVARLWGQETRLLLIPIIFTTAGLLHHGFDALIRGANLDLPAPSGSDIYAPLVADVIFLTLYIVGYANLRRESRSIS